MNHRARPSPAPGVGSRPQCRLSREATVPYIARTATTPGREATAAGDFVEAADSTAPRPPQQSATRENCSSEMIRRFGSTRDFRPTHLSKQFREFRRRLGGLPKNTRPPPKKIRRLFVLSQAWRGVGYLPRCCCAARAVSGMLLQRRT